MIDRLLNLFLGHNPNWTDADIRHLSSPSGQFWPEGLNRYF